ncbi:MAG: hypothetical protein KDD69_05015 [Bdellovibrionales bacterium]|nr:hypothetical protein [Bdellovibrionales bacterium]
MGNSFGSVFAGFLCPTLERDQLLEALKVVRSKLIEAGTSPQALADADVLERQLDNGVVQVEKAAWLAKELSKDPVSDTDREMMRELIAPLSYFRIVYLAAELVAGFDDCGMPYDHAILEARQIIAAVQNGTTRGLDEFMKQPEAPAALRTMHHYITTQTPTPSFAEPWEEMKLKVQILPLIAKMCELTRTPS